MIVSVSKLDKENEIKARAEDDGCSSLDHVRDQPVDQGLRMPPGCA